ncbi:MAG TPA: hypothetical protein PLW27_11475 [Kiritimatiellia bacterium]|nr:hypothetical protein [Kiritimatiellia bacterium]
MRTKGDYMNVAFGGTMLSGQPFAAAVAARALRAAGFTVIALDEAGELLDEKAALRGGAGKAAKAVPVLVSVRGGEKSLRKARRRLRPVKEGGGHGQG